MISNPSISIVICTYNRYEFLEKCLIKLSNINIYDCEWEVIVIDNNSSDMTEQISASYSEILKLKYFKELKQGLAHARNRGYFESKNEWIVYLDDDALPFDNFLERILFVIGTQKFDAWGGIDIPYFPKGHPIWLKTDYVQARLPYKNLSIINNKHYFFSGGAMVLNRKDLVDLSGFNVNTGMKGQFPGYGEETELQVRLREAGKRLGYDPELKFYHAILPHKLNLAWFFKYSFAIGRDNIETYSLEATFKNIFLQFFLGFSQMIFLFLIKSPKLILKDYFLENWIIEVFRKFSKRIGTVFYLIKIKTKNRKWVEAH